MWTSVDTKCRRAHWPPKKLKLKEKILPQAGTLLLLPCEIKKKNKFQNYFPAKILVFFCKLNKKVKTQEPGGSSLEVPSRVKKNLRYAMIISA